MSFSGAVEIQSMNLLIAENYGCCNEVKNKSAHPIVQEFFNLGNTGIIENYLKCKPEVSRSVLKEYLEYVPSFFFWAGQFPTLIYKYKNGIHVLF